MKNIFEEQEVLNIINRINQLTDELKPSWGKMSVDQMLAHCNVTYELIFEPTKHKKPNAFKRVMLKAFVKGFVVTEKPYKKSSPTAAEFIITDQKNFEFEKERLIKYIKEAQRMGRSEFEGRPSFAFGKLTAQEWNNLFYKHLNHHLEQFGV